MKKKFINGILMVAMLFAATTSFVSCKDNVDDQLVDVYATIEQVRANLQNQLDGLSGRISALEGRMDSAEAEINKLKGEVTRLQGEIDALDVRVTNLESRVTAIESRLSEIEARVSALEEQINEMITDIFVKETTTPIVGTINLPIVHDNFLGAYYAQIVTDIDAFPYESQKDSKGWIKSGVTVDQDGGNRLIRQEISNQVTRVKFKTGQMSTNFEGNAGKLYFSLNPVDVNVDNVTFSMVNSLGNVNPIELTGVEKSAHKITWAAGKHGNGTTTNTADENVPSGYLYEATATMPITNIMDNDFPYMNVFKQSLVASDVKAMIADIKNNNKMSALKQAATIMENFYQSELQLRSKMAYWDLQAEKTLSDGTTKKYVGNDHVTIATVRPLSYNFFWTLNEGYGNDLLKAYVDIDDLATIVAGFMKVVTKVFPKINFESYKVKAVTVEDGEFRFQMTTAPDGVYYTDDNSLMWGSSYDPETNTWTYDPSVDGSYHMAVGADKVFAGVDGLVDQINDLIDKLSKKYNAVSNPDTDNLATKVNNFLNNVSNKLITTFGTHYAYRAVAPILLVATQNEGVVRLYPGNVLKQEFPTTTFFMTSPTEEYLVPAMYKYIAVLKEGKPVEAHLEAGWNKVQDLNLPEGDIEIIYQTVDFNGYVVTKRYPITVIK